MVKTAKLLILFFTAAITMGCSAGVHADNILLDKDSNTIYYLYEPVDPELEKKYDAVPKFSDVPSDSDYHEAILFLIQYGISSPKEDPRFYPDRGITQKEAAEMLALFSEPGFAKETEDAVQWCKDRNILPRSMIKDFSPDQTITREEAAYFFDSLANYENSRILTEIQKQMTAYPQTFADAGDISNWAATAVNRMNIIGLFPTEENNYFHPQRAVTRSEFAKALYLYFRLDRIPTIDNGKTPAIEYIEESPEGITDFYGNAILSQRDPFPEHHSSKNDITNEVLMIAFILCGLCVIGGGVYIARKK